MVIKPTPIPRIGVPSRGRLERTDCHDQCKCVQRREPGGLSRNVTESCARRHKPCHWAASHWSHNDKIRSVSEKIRNISRIWVRIGVSRGNARLAPFFARSVFKDATRVAEDSAPFFGAFQAFSSPLENKSFRISNETRTKGDPMQAQRSGLHGEKEETRSTAEEKAAAF